MYLTMWSFGEDTSSKIILGGKGFAVDSALSVDETRPELHVIVLKTSYA